MFSFCKLIFAQENMNREINKFDVACILSTYLGRTENKFVLSKESYDNYITGISSGISNPIKRSDEIYTSGIAYVKYNSENGMIKKGDLITASSQSGFGMKATKSGMIVGVALEDATNDSGLIKIRISIQYVAQ